MNQPSVEAIKKFNLNELKSEFAKSGVAIQGKKEELFRRLNDAIQEDNSDKQLSISFIKEIFLSMFQEQNQKTLEILKKHGENVTSIVNDKIPSINQRLDKLTLDINCIRYSEKRFKRKRCLLIK